MASPAFAPSSRPISSVPLPGIGVGSTESKNEVDQLQDLLGLSGVDLRAEEEAIHGQHAGPSDLSTTGSQPGLLTGAQPASLYLEVHALSTRVHKIARQSGLGVEPDVVNLLSMAAKIRSRNLLEAMVAASRHRQWSSHLRPPPTSDRTGLPMYHEEVYEDPQKLLSALGRAEKAEEQIVRQLRMQRDERGDQIGDVADRTNNGILGIAETGSSAADAAAQDDAKRKQKRVAGASAAARNMTEDKRLKLANKTAAQQLGISAGSKAWMFGNSGGTLSGGLGKGSHPSSPGQAAVPSRLPKPRFAPPPNASTASDSMTMPTDGQAAGTVDNLDEHASSITADGGAVNPGGWGDLALRQRHREEEELRRTRSVNLEDALHALDMERKGGAGRGSGDRVLFAVRALGRPTLPAVSVPTSL